MVPKASGSPVIDRALMGDPPQDTPADVYVDACAGFGIQTKADFLRALQSTSQSKVTGVADISVADVKALTTGLRVSKSVKFVKLYSNRIGDEGASAIADLLQDNTVIERLYLRQNQIGSSGAQALAYALRQNSGLTELSVFENQIGEEGALELVEGIGDHPSIRRLTLSSDGIGDKGATAIGELLKMNSRITRICLEDNGIGSLGARALAEGLDVNNTVDEVSIFDNPITNAGVESLAQSLLRRCAEINLSKCRLGVKGVERFTRTVEELDQYRTTALLLDHNSIASRGARALARCLLRLPYLQVLSLQNNNIGNKGAEAVARNLASCRSLSSVAMDCNIIHYDGAMALVMAYRDHPSIEDLGLAHNYLTMGDESEIRRALAGSAKRAVRMDDQKVRDLPFLSEVQEEHYFDSRDDSMTAIESVWSSYLQDCESHGRRSESTLTAFIDRLTGKHDAEEEILITDLILSNHNPGRMELQALGKVISYPNTLTSIKMDNSADPSFPHAFVDFAYSLRGTSNLLSLSVQSCGLEAPALQAVLESIVAGSSLREVDISHNRIGDEGADIVGQFLGRGCQLSHVRLVNCGITGRGAKRLGDRLMLAAQLNGSLVSLGLDDNNIGDEGMKDLSRGLQRCKALSYLSLRITNLTEPSGKDIAQVMSSCHLLSVLLLDHNILGDNGVTSICNSIRTAGSLTTLSMKDNGVSDSVRDELSRAYRDNATLKEFILSGTAVTTRSIALQQQSPGRAHVLSSPHQAYSPKPNVIPPTNSPKRSPPAPPTSPPKASGPMSAIEISATTDPRGTPTLQAGGRLAQYLYDGSSAIAPSPSPSPLPAQNVTSTALPGSRYSPVRMPAYQQGRSSPVPRAVSPSSPVATTGTRNRGTEMNYGSSTYGASAYSATEAPVMAMSHSNAPTPPSASILNTKTSGNVGGGAAADLANELAVVTQNLGILEKRKDDLTRAYRAAEERAFAAEAEHAIGSAQAASRNSEITPERQLLTTMKPVSSEEKMRETDLSRRHVDSLGSHEEAARKELLRVQKLAGRRQEVDSSISSLKNEAERMEDDIRNTMNANRPDMNERAEMIYSNKAEKEATISQLLNEKFELTAQHIAALKKIEEHYDAIIASKAERCSHLNSAIAVPVGNTAERKLAALTEIAGKLKGVIDGENEKERARDEERRAAAQHADAVARVDALRKELADAERNEEMLHSSLESARRNVTAVDRDQEITKIKLGISSFTTQELRDALPRFQDRHRFYSRMLEEHNQTAASIASSEGEKAGYSQERMDLEEEDRRKKLALEKLNEYIGYCSDLDKKQDYMRDLNAQHSSISETLKEVEAEKQASLADGDWAQFKHIEADIAKLKSQLSAVAQNRADLESELDRLVRASNAILDEVAASDSTDYVSMLFAAHLPKRARTKRVGAPKTPSTLRHNANNLDQVWRMGKI